MPRRRRILEFTPLFEADLNEIVDYIAVELGNPQAAERLVNLVRSEIEKRAEFPESFEPYKSAKARENPYYRIYVKNWTIFYVVLGNRMQVRRILYSARDLDQLGL